jgi:hypothetical protein
VGRLRAVRAELKAKNLAAMLVVTGDRHNSEFAGGA